MTNPAFAGDDYSLEDSGLYFGATRDLQQRGLDIINIRDVTGSGYLAKLKNAVAYAKSIGSHARTIYLPSGGYDLGICDLADIDADNIEIRGDGPSTILKLSLPDTGGASADTYGTVFTLTGRQIRVRDMTIVYDVSTGMLLPKLPTFDIRCKADGTGGSDILIENILLTNLTALAVIGSNAGQAVVPAQTPVAYVSGPSRVTLRQISGDYNLDQPADFVLVNGGTNLRFSDGKFNGAYLGTPPATLPDTAMVRFAAKAVIDTYSFTNWGSQAKGDGSTPLQRFDFVIDCTHGSVVNGTMSGTNVFDHVSEAEILIRSELVSGTLPGPEDVKFGGLVATGLRSNADTGVSRKVDWQGNGYFRGYIEIGGRLQAADTALLVVNPAPNTTSFLPPLYESCTFRSTAPGGATLPYVFEIAAPCDIVNSTIENSGVARIARLGKVVGSPVWRLTGCDVNDVLDPTINYLASENPDVPTTRNPKAVVTGNIGVFEDSVLDAAAIPGPYLVATARWLRSGSSDPTQISSSSRKAIYDKLIQGLYDQGLVDRFGLLALLSTKDDELSLHDVLVPSRRFVKIGMPAFTADKGWMGSGSNMLDTGYIPASDPKLSSTSIALLTCCTGMNVSSAEYDMGCGSTLRMSVRNTADRIAARLNTSAVAQSSTTASPTSIGTFLCNRIGTNAQFYDAAGSRGSASSLTTVALPTTPLTLCGVSGASTGHTIRAAAVMKGFDPATESAKITAMIAAFQSCFAAIDAL